MTSSTQASQAEQNPLGNRKHLSSLLFFFCFEGRRRKELEMTRTGSWFHHLPHYEWAPPHQTDGSLYTRQTSQSLNQHSESQAFAPASQTPAPEQRAGPNGGSQLPLPLPGQKAPPVPTSLRRQPVLQSNKGGGLEAPFEALATRGGRQGGRAPAHHATYRQKTCSHCPRDTGSRRTPALWAEEGETRQH